jgi:hypothetical protein
MNEPRCPGCHHPTPLHTMDCDYRNPLYPILTDLIAELRRTTKGYLSPRAYAITVEQQREMADAAEARLREAMRNDE